MTDTESAASCFSTSAIWLGLSGGATACTYRRAPSRQLRRLSVAAYGVLLSNENMRCLAPFEHAIGLMQAMKPYIHSHHCLTRTLILLEILGFGRVSSSKQETWGEASSNGGRVLPEASPTGLCSSTYVGVGRCSVKRSPS